MFRFSKSVLVARGLCGCLAFLSIKCRGLSHTLFVILVLTWHTQSSTLFAAQMSAANIQSLPLYQAEIILNPDGTFTSPSTNSNYIEINEGDTVRFSGLDKTNGIVSC